MHVSFNLYASPVVEMTVVEIHSVSIQQAGSQEFLVSRIKGCRLRLASNTTSTPPPPPFQELGIP